MIWPFCISRKQLRSKAALGTDTGNQHGQRHLNAMVELLGGWSNIVAELAELDICDTVLGLCVTPLHTRVAETAFDCFNEFKQDKHIDSWYDKAQRMDASAGTNSFSVDTAITPQSAGRGGPSSSSFNLSTLDHAISQLSAMRLLACQYQLFLEQCGLGAALTSADGDMARWREVDGVYVVLEGAYLTRAVHEAVEQCRDKRLLEVQTGVWILQVRLCSRPETRQYAMECAFVTTCVSRRLWRMPSSCCTGSWRGHWTFPPRLSSSQYATGPSSSLTEMPCTPMPSLFGLWSLVDRLPRGVAADCTDAAPPFTTCSERISSKCCLDGASIWISAACPDSQSPSRMHSTLLVKPSLLQGLPPQQGHWAAVGALWLLPRCVWSGILTPVYIYVALHADEAEGVGETNHYASNIGADLAVGTMALAEVAGNARPHRRTDRLTSSPSDSNYCDCDQGVGWPPSPVQAVAMVMATE